MVRQYFCDILWRWVVSYSVDGKQFKRIMKNTQREVELRIVPSNGILGGKVLRGRIYFRGA